MLISNLCTQIVILVIAQVGVQVTVILAVQNHVRAVVAVVQVHAIVQVHVVVVAIAIAMILALVVVLAVVQELAPDHALEHVLTIAKVLAQDIAKVVAQLDAHRVMGVSLVVVVTVHAKSAVTLPVMQVPMHKS